MTIEAGARPLDAPRFFVSPVRVALAAIVLIALGAAAYAVHGPGRGTALSISLVFGAAFGIVLQRSRFCFFCNFRDWYDTGDARGLIGIVVALAVTLLGYTLVFGAWLPDASTGRLPPDAFIGPVGPALVIAGLVFGAGMAISGSCVSAHLYRLGEGSPTAPFALIGTVAGFIAGFLTWNSFYLPMIQSAPVVWLPAYLGYAGALVIALAVLGAIAWLLTLRARRGAVPAVPSRGPWYDIFVARWPAWIGGVLVGVLGAASYLRVAPLGVTAEISARARQLGDVLGVMPLRLEGLDTLRGCVSLVRDAALSPNGAFVIALVLASFAAALTAGQFKPAWPTRAQVLRGLGGGVLLGWGAMIGLGCTIGTLLSGIGAGALSGWVFGAAVFAGTALTLTFGRKVGIVA